MALIKRMKDYINSDDSDFKIFKLKYTDLEIKCINSFNISKSETYNHMGNKNNMENITTFLNKIGTNDKDNINILGKTIIKILDNVLAAFDIDHFWITIRVSLPTDYFNIPSWHKDGRFFFNSKSQKSPKFITVLKGPGTLLIKSTKKVNKIYNDISQKITDEFTKLKNITINDNNKIYDKYRLIFSEALKNVKIIQLTNNECVICHPELTQDAGAIHSEPKMDTPRLFISILPGSKKDILELKKRWNIK